jgi:hypothetical protein
LSFLYFLHLFSFVSESDTRRLHPAARRRVRYGV